MTSLHTQAGMTGENSFSIDRRRIDLGKSDIAVFGYSICPYVQRVLILLNEIGLPYRTEYVDVYGAPPEWLRTSSPLGKVPLVFVDGEAIFESTAILEFLDELSDQKFNPGTFMERAQRRGWMGVCNAAHDVLRIFFTSTDSAAVSNAFRELHKLLRRADGEARVIQMGGDEITLLDVVFAPLFILLDALNSIHPIEILDTFPNLNAASVRLLSRPSVKKAVPGNYHADIKSFVEKKKSIFALQGAPLLSS